MLLLISPAKTLDYASAVPPAVTALATQPRCLPQAATLIKSLKRKSVRSVAGLMDLSPTLAELNVERYRAWEEDHSPVNARPAVLAFNGDVYEGLRANTLAIADLLWAQQQLRILSGLYGLMRPLDWLQPYRLEMGTTLAVGRARNLYGYWGERIARLIEEDLAHRIAQGGEPVVVNLASQEYFKAVAPKALKARVLHCHFQEAQGNGPYKVISFHAKRARGLMARFAIQQRAQAPQALKAFNEEGYALDEQACDADNWVFRRHMG